MNWFRTTVSRILSPSYQALSGATWKIHFTAIAQISSRECTGVVQNARQFCNIQWIRFVGITSRGSQVLLKNDLAHWEGDDFVVHDYDTVGEAIVKHRSYVGRLGAQIRWENAAKQDALGISKGISQGTGKGISQGTASLRPSVRTSVPDPPDPPRTYSRRTGTNPKALPWQEGPFSAVAINRVKETWPWRESFVPEAVKRSLERYGRDRIDEIIAGMKRDTANPKWRQKNLVATAASYIRGGQWITEPKKPVPKNGASNGKPAKLAKPSNNAASELEDLKRDFSKTFPGKEFPGREKAWSALAGSIGRKLADRKSVGDA